MFTKLVPKFLSWNSGSGSDDQSLSDQTDTSMMEAVVATAATAAVDREMKLSGLHDDIYDRFNTTVTLLLYDLLSHEPGKLTRGDEFSLSSYDNCSIAVNDKLQQQTWSRDYSCRLRQYVQGCEPLPFVKSLEMQKIVLNSYFQRLVNRLAALEPVEAGIISRVWLSIEQQFTGLMSAASSRRLLLDICSKQSFAELYSLHRDYLRQVQVDINTLLEVLARLHQRHGIIRHKRRSGEIKEINYKSLLSKLQLLQVELSRKRSVRT